ncbi:MAG TPA: hypothetical protein VFM90_00815, partial [Cyclobacteriaceae bacterium]|nr:hypothetical protein [Cyclobacteriaceae bacterium]
SLWKERWFGFRGDEFQEIKLNDDTLELKIELLNPSRKAVSIKQLKGKIYFYNPGLDAKSKITAKGFTNRPNQSLLTVKDPSFDVLYVDAEAYKFMQQAEKEKVNKQIALLSESGQQTARQANSFFDSFNNADVGPNALHFYVKDVHAQFLRFEFRDEDGKAVEPGMTREGNKMYSFGFRKPVTQQWQVTLLLITPKSLITIPFDLKNIALP